MLRWDSSLDFGDPCHSYFNRRYVSATAYAQQCYNTTSAAQECSTYVRKELPIRIDKNMNCPFPGKDKICLFNSTNLRLDTGLIDSHYHLGINTEPEKRFAYRRVDECAPLDTERYTRVNDSAPFSPYNATAEYFFGGKFMEGKFLRNSLTYRTPFLTEANLNDVLLNLNSGYELR